MKRVHHDLIVAWAAGAKIQWLNWGVWEDLETPGWDPDIEYRIKPVRKENSVKIVRLFEPDGYEWNSLGWFRVTTDGDTEKVLNIEVLME